MIRVLVVDDEPRVRSWLSRSLNLDLDIEVVGECADGADVCDTAVRVRPDVVLMDMYMPVMSGPEATRSLLESQPGIRVLMLSAVQNLRALDEAAQAGAVGYLVKDGDSRSLRRALRIVANGGTAWPGETTRLTGSESYAGGPAESRSDRGSSLCASGLPPIQLPPASVALAADTRGQLGPESPSR